MKGIILAGGSGNRLFPTTVVCNKQLQSVYDKPMIYYPLTTLIESGICEILIISSPQDVDSYKKLFKYSSCWGLKISYAVQDKPEGIAQAFTIGEKFINGDNVALILGDNLFYGASETFDHAVNDFTERGRGATIFGYRVSDPSQYGVVELKPDGDPVGLIEKPKNPQKNHLAIPGFYIYDDRVVEYTRELTPSARGELEITDLNNRYFQDFDLRVDVLGRGVAWLDTGNPSDMQRAASFIETIEDRQNVKIGCPEEAAFRTGLIDENNLKFLLDEYPKCAYSDYLKAIIS